ncbi:MAG: hypothetical protein ONB31_11175 [candidate division KSB1 bacterium]|nr:hypothetical protein [candidate division KSB1 bacterium]MDZ7334796.1 hypothetical protein [candidate division KSB1 bacterium]MDZ7357607.1 hypothetical protein [candidate division KSB1 bacterium]MDZ7400793.1 hypothetical protein [candidate division KSB1 bacterium]
MSDYFQSGIFNRRRMLAGAIIIVIGVLILLNNLGIIDLGRVIAEIGPSC